MNARGFSSSVPYLRILLEDHDCVAVSEHWLHVNRLHKLNEVSNDFHVIARASRAASADNYGVSRGQGGVALFWRKSIAGASPLKSLVHDRICGIKIQLDSGSTLYIYSVYLPSIGSDDNYDYVLDELNVVISTIEPDDTLIICGDLNGNIGCLGGQRGVDRPNKHGNSLNKFLCENNLVALNMLNRCSGPIHTHVGPLGSSTLDYIVVRKRDVDLVKSISVIDDPIMNLSDHRVVSGCFEYRYNEDLLQPSDHSGTLKWGKITGNDIRTKYTNPLADDLTQIRESLLHDDMSEHKLDQFVDEIIRVIKKAEKVIPRAKYRPNIKPYRNDNLSDLKRKKIASYRIWVADGRPRDVLNLYYVQYKMDKRNFAKEIRKVSREYENNEILNMVKACEVNKNFFWKMVKRVKSPTSRDSIAIKDEHDVVKHEIKEVLCVWRNHFDKLGTPKHDIQFDQDHFYLVNEFRQRLARSDDSDEFSENHFTVAEIRSAIERLNSG